MKDSIEKLLEKDILKEEDQYKDDIYRTHWRVSNSGRCYRYQYWYRMGIEMSDPVDLKVLKIFRVGDLFHRDLQSLLPENTVEVNLITEDVTGHCDRLGNNFVEDFKTVNSLHWNFITKKDYDVEKDNNQYCYQLMKYCHFFNKPEGRLTFINKNTYEMRTFVIEYKDWKKRIEEELVQLREYWKTQELPPAIPRCYGFKECNYCSFRKECNRIEGTDEKERAKLARDQATA